MPYILAERNWKASVCPNTHKAWEHTSQGQKPSFLNATLGFFSVIGRPIPKETRALSKMTQTLKKVCRQQFYLECEGMYQACSLFCFQQLNNYKQLTTTLAFWSPGVHFDSLPEPGVFSGCFLAPLLRVSSCSNGKKLCWTILQPSLK